MIHRSNLALIVEDWYDIALRMKSDEKANKAFGWILEMVRCCPQRSGAENDENSSRSCDQHPSCRGCAVCIRHCVFASSWRSLGIHFAR